VLFFYIYIYIYIRVTRSNLNHWKSKKINKVSTRWLFFFNLNLSLSYRFFTWTYKDKLGLINMLLYLLSLFTRFSSFNFYLQGIYDQACLKRAKQKLNYISPTTFTHILYGQEKYDYVLSREEQERNTSCFESKSLSKTWCWKSYSMPEARSFNSLQIPWKQFPTTTLLPLFCTF
jgi:hypothetical protein